MKIVKIINKYVKNEKILEKLRFIKRYFQSDFQSLKRDKEQRVICLYTPEHSNLGDHMIVYSQDCLMNDYLPEKILQHKYEFSNLDWKYLKKQLWKTIRENDIIIIPGGGYIGTLWPEVETDLIEIFSSFRKSHIIVFPQTAYFENNVLGKEYIAELKNVVAECKDIVFFARDKASYEVLKRDIGLSMDNCFYTPDMVTYFDYSNEEERTTNILFVFRNDCEGVLNDVLESKLTEIREMQEMQVVKTNTHATVYVNKNNRISVLNDKLKEFSRASLVITDRLHAMLFAAITGTPCIAFDNKSKKVSGQYEWIKNLDYVIQISPEAFTTELVQKMMKKNGRYSNKELKKYYDIMAEIIKKRMI